MATSAFKSTTKRAPIGASSSGGSSSRSPRRSRSLSRLSRPIAAEAEPDYIKNAPKGKFVNTKRGSSAAAFPEISLDDLALEFFSSSSWNENESDVGRERVGWSVSRRGEEIGRLASDRASSRRRGRSVSRSRGDAISSSEVKKAFASSAVGSRRRRSLSTARYHQISDSESHSSALTDEESKHTRIMKKGSEKIIRTVYARNKADHPTEDVSGGGLYEAMKNELRYAVQEIRTEINQAMGSNHTASTSGQRLQPDSFRDNYAKKLEKHIDDLDVLLLEEQLGLDVSRKVKELPDSRSSSATQRLSQGRKRSTDKSRTSKKLSEEAERIIEDFVSNVEDTDISSFDGERSDGSSIFGGIMKSRNAVVTEADIYKSPAGSASHPAEMDGVILPWLQWETSGDGTLPWKNNATLKALKRDAEKDIVWSHDTSSYSTSSHGSWSPGLFSSPTIMKKDSGKTTQVSKKSPSFDMDEYLCLENDDKILFEAYRERSRISSGGLLLCTGVP